MFENYIGKEVELGVAFSNGLADGGAVPEWYNCILLKEEDDFVEVEIIEKRNNKKAIFVKRFIIGIIEG